MSNDVSSSYSSSTNATKGFESIATSSPMIEFSPASTKIKRIAKIIWYLHSKEVDAFILKIKVA
jgi:hypothetical protein